MPIVSIPEAIQTYRQGKFVIIVDDEKRENEGDLVIAAEAITPEAVTFMARKASGLICVQMACVYLDRLGLGMMVPPNRNGTRSTSSSRSSGKHGTVRMCLLSSSVTSRVPATTPIPSTAWRWSGTG